MKITLVLLNLLLSSSLFAHPGHGEGSGHHHKVAEGDVVLNRGFLNCSIKNYSEKDARVLQLSYKYICRNVWNQDFQYNYKLGCRGINSCEVRSGSRKLFAGPSLYNCRVVDALCSFSYKTIKADDGTGIRD